ncbi:hypothetical protein Tsubulata_005466 [Turnera subulata]|uniref:Uncharacterized protein n=1 Tax=Turnera subulata TaxID=218843 RepID=A0A9Q0JBM5_9ROSI|nr:hypothetical protein Tsubulata_005466 [Turnera subulata]
MARSPTGSQSTGTPLDSLYFLLSSSCFHCPDRVYSAGDHLGSTFRRGCLELDPRVINGDETRDLDGLVWNALAGVDRFWCLGFVWFGLIADLNRSAMLGSLYVLWVVRCWFVN